MAQASARQAPLQWESIDMNYSELIAQERKAYCNAPMRELRNVRLALAFHSWGNTTQEQARAQAIETIIHERLGNK
jgi:hypothetical protein